MSCGYLSLHKVRCSIREQILAQTDIYIDRKTLQDYILLLLDAHVSYRMKYVVYHSLETLLPMQQK